MLMLPPISRMYVPPVTMATPASEPLWGLRKRLRDMVTQLEQEGRWVCFVVLCLSLLAVLGNNMQQV